MKTTKPSIRARFAPETRFKLPLPAGPSPKTGVAELERLKERLLQAMLEPTDPEWLHQPFRRAADDASALAWATPWPLLVLPLLLEEKIQAARRQARRQQEVLQRSRALGLETA